MLQIIVILLVAYVVVPLIDLSLNAHVALVVKLVVYVVTLLWVVWTCFVGKMG